MIWITNPENLNWSRSSSVAGTHVSVSLSDGISDVSGSVLTVHVVWSRSRIVSEPDSNVLYQGWWFLGNLLDWDDFASSLVYLGLFLLSQPLKMWILPSCSRKQSTRIATWRRLGQGQRAWLCKVVGEVGLLLRGSTNLDRAKWPWRTPFRGGPGYKFNNVKLISSKQLRSCLIQSWWQLAAGDDKFTEITFALHFCRSLKNKLLITSLR